MGWLQDEAERWEKAKKATRVLLADSEPATEQIGCGYCSHELSCQERDPKINKAKAGCNKFNHYLNTYKQDGEPK